MDIIQWKIEKSKLFEELLLKNCITLTKLLNKINNVLSTVFTLDWILK